MKKSNLKHQAVKLDKCGLIGIKKETTINQLSP